MADDADIIIVSRVEDGPPAVPSAETKCSRCDVAVWLSIPMATFVPTALPVCWFCMATLPDLAPHNVSVQVKRWQLDTLRVNGWTEERIAAWLAVMDITVVPDDPV